MSKKPKEKTPLKASYNLGEIKLPKPEIYIGTHIKGDLGGVKVSNKSYKKYYKGMI